MQHSRRSEYFFTGLVLCLAAGCTTQGDLKREQEVERLRAEVREMKGNRVDIDVVGEELKNEVTRLSTLYEEQAQLMRLQNEELRKEIGQLNSRLQTLEQAPRAAAPAAPVEEARSSGEKSKPSYELAKRAYEEGKFGEATEILRTVLKNPANTDEARKSQYLMGEALYSDKEYASAALEFGEFKRAYPKDSLLANATYRQANAFRAMGKNKEAKLFYQELIEKFPKSPLAAKSKSEMKKLK